MDSQRATSRLASQLGAGAAILVAAAFLFGTIAQQVVSGAPLTVLDAELATWLHRRTGSPWTELLLVITHLHSAAAIACYAIVAAIVLGCQRRWRSFVTVIVTVAGGLTLNVLMKLAFERPRPRFDDPLLTLDTYSFPSGHVAGSTIFYGLCLTWVYRRTRRLGWRLSAVAFATVAVFLVALSRMVLGVHYLSDVVAAFAEGVAWLTLCLTALHAFWRDTARPHAAVVRG
jgi:membrane-associated phospholipid phosphatase